MQVLAQVYRIAEQIVGWSRNIYQNAMTVGGFIPGAEGGAVSLLSMLNGIYANATTAVLDYVGIVDGVRIAQQVVEQNDPTAELDFAAYGLLLNRLRIASGHEVPGGGLGLAPPMLERHVRPSQQGEDHAGMNRFRNVVMGSRDRFSANRGQNIRWWPISGGTYGGTDMVDYERWVGIDTMDVRIWLPWPFSDLRIPLGWGGAQAVGANAGYPAFLPGIQAASNGGAGWYSYFHSRDYAQFGGSGGSTARLADQFPSVNTPWLWGQANYFIQRQDAYYSPYQGLQPYHDVKPEVARTPEGQDAGPVFTIYLHSGIANARTSEVIDGLGSASPDGPLHLASETVPGERLTAVASAQTYFHRPRDQDGLFHRFVPRTWNGQPESDDQFEMGSLFSPYWQARLVDTPMEDYVLIGIDQLIGGI